MNALVKAINANETVTANGMQTYTSSMDSCVDFFFQAAAARPSGLDVTAMFSKAFAEEPEVAVRLSLWLRDVRGGAGERQSFKQVFTYLIEKDVDLARRVLVKIPELGRWDDVLAAFKTPLERDALSLINHALKDEKSGLCAKWMPRKGEAANTIRKYLQVSPKVYRKLVVTLSDTVEQKMCKKDWENINYSHVPSVAAARYQAAFSKADPEGYATYRADLEKGVDKDGNVVKVNAGAVYPYDVIKSLQKGQKQVANAQWDALPNYLEDSVDNILPIVDTSYSMGVSAGDSNSLTCMDVAISLGLYISERTEGSFKDHFITFDSTPRMLTVKGSLSDRYNQMAQAPWGGSTNLEKTFKLVLDSAVSYNVPAEDMPTTLLILSDMQFNACDRNFSQKAIEMIKDQYSDAGYEMPKIVFWNINASNGGSPVTVDHSGTALVSGFSPSIMASVLGADMEQFTPRSVMLKALDNERYMF